MKPIEEQTILVTGATDGLGRGVALNLAERGATVLVHGRDEGRIAETLHEIHSVIGNVNARSYRSDFSSLAEVRELAKAIRETEPRLDGLINNAGIGTTLPGGGVRQESHDGIELRFQVNYLAHYVLTRALLPLLRSSAPARIVNVASAGQAPIDFDDAMLVRDYTGTRAYCQSKLAQISFTLDLAEELSGSGVTVNALHPATYMPTKIVANPTGSLDEGVFATVRQIIDPALDGVTGEYFDGLMEQRAHPQAYDVEARRKLGRLSDELALNVRKR